jgi:hypothetical protein
LKKKLYIIIPESEPRRSATEVYVGKSKICSIL